MSGIFVELSGHRAQHHLSALVVMRVREVAAVLRLAPQLFRVIIIHGKDSDELDERNLT